MVVWLELYCSSIRMCVCTVTQQAKQSSTQHSSNDGLILRLHPAQNNSFKQNHEQKGADLAMITHTLTIYVLVQKLYIQTKGFKFFPSNFKAQNKQKNQKRKNERELAFMILLWNISKLKLKWLCICTDVRHTAGIFMSSYTTPKHLHTVRSSLMLVKTNPEDFSRNHSRVIFIGQIASKTRTVLFLWCYFNISSNNREQFSQKITYKTVINQFKYKICLHLQFQFTVVLVAFDHNLSFLTMFNLLFLTISCFLYILFYSAFKTETTHCNLQESVLGIYKLTCPGE